MMQTNSFNPSDFPLKRARKVLARSRAPVWLKALNWIAAVLFLALLVGGLLNLAGSYATDREMISFIGLAYALVLWLSVLDGFRNVQQLNQNLLYSDGAIVSISEEGVTFTGQGASLKVSWNGVKDVVETESGDLILLKGNWFIPIPTTAFKSDADFYAFSRAVRTHSSNTKAAL